MVNREPQLSPSSHLQLYQLSVIPLGRRLDSDPVAIAPGMAGVTGTQAQPDKTLRIQLHLPLVDLAEHHAPWRRGSGLYRQLLEKLSDNPKVQRIWCQWEMRDTWKPAEYHPSFLRTRNRHTLETVTVVDMEILHPDPPSRKGLIWSWGSTISRQPLRGQWERTDLPKPHPPRAVCLLIEAWYRTPVSNFNSRAPPPCWSRLWPTSHFHF